jgi:hypothetical protein
MKKILWLLALVIIGNLDVVMAQKTWIDPGGTDFNPEDSVKIYVDITQCDQQALKDFAGDVFIWTWSPSENQGPYKQGAWNSSNEELKMTRTANPNVYFFPMIPVEFYAVGASDVYSKGFSFLVKAKDGADQGNGEMKTEDLTIKPEKPGIPKVFTMPSVPKSLKKKTDTGLDTLPISMDDFVTFYYNSKLEALPAMQNLTDSEELHVFVRTTGSDDKVYLNVRKTQLGLDAASKMKARGDGLFTATYNLRSLWENSGITAAFTPPPPGVTPKNVEVIFAKCNAAQPNVDLAPKAEGSFIWSVEKCQ